MAVSDGHVESTRWPRDRDVLIEQSGAPSACLHLRGLGSLARPSLGVHVAGGLEAGVRWQAHAVSQRWRHLGRLAVERVARAIRSGR